MTERKRAARSDDAIRRLPDNKGWEARPTLGRDPVSGKQVRAYKRFPTKKAAREWIDEERRKWAAGSWAARSERTFGDVCDHWLTVREADDRVRTNTVRADRESLAHARRAFAEVPVQKITPAQLVDWSLNLRTRHGKNPDGSERPGRPLAAATKRRAIVTAQAVFRHALRMKWIDHDPSEYLQPPAQKVVVAVGEGDVWTADQMTRFLDSVAEHRLSGCFALTLLGLRREEVAGLRWADVNLQRGELRITRARVDVNGREEVGDPKTVRSVRVLPIPARELAFMKAMRRTHLRERLAVGAPLGDGDLLMSREDGRPLPVREYSRMFVELRDAARLPAITLRNVRHSSVSRMRAAGVAADVVAAWHGHSERMTTAVYGRVSDERLSAASAVLSEAVANS